MILETPFPFPKFRCTLALAEAGTTDTGYSAPIANNVVPFIVSSS
jgi:hypothetical protein